MGQYSICRIIRWLYRKWKPSDQTPLRRVRRQTTTPSFRLFFLSPDNCHWSSLYLLQSLDKYNKISGVFVFVLHWLPPTGVKRKDNDNADDDPSGQAKREEEATWSLIACGQWSLGISGYSVRLDNYWGCDTIHRRTWALHNMSVV